MPYRIGHPAYSGVNRLAFASSKAKAVEILRNRGAKRDLARDVVNLAEGKTHAVLAVENGVVEVVFAETIPFEGENPSKRKALVSISTKFP